MRKQSVTG